MTEASLRLPKFTIGVGDRFALQGRAQVRACALALEYGAEVVPVWNKSNREHLIVGSEPGQTRQAVRLQSKIQHGPARTSSIPITLV
jgi:hypothetical protein